MTVPQFSGLPYALNNLSSENIIFSFRWPDAVFVSAFGITQRIRVSLKGDYNSERYLKQITENFLQIIIES